MTESFLLHPSNNDLASQCTAMLECGVRSTEDATTSNSSSSRGSCSQLELRWGEGRRTLRETVVTSAPVFPVRTRSMVCRTSVFACVFIVCVHLLLVWSVDVAPTIDRIARQGASIVAPKSLVLTHPHQGQEEGEGASRAKRSMADDVMQVKNDELSERSELSAERKKMEGNERKKSSSICHSGHIQGLSASVCTDAQPCLRRLPKHPIHPPPSPSASYSSSPAAHDVLRRISRIPGRLDAVHLSLIPFLSEFQWKNGMYGSVGEFGVTLGKFTALLSTYTDVEAGERLFVCDSFNRSTSGGSRTVPSGLSPFNVFMTHMTDFGFDEEESAEPRRVHLHRGTSTTFDRHILSTWDLPQFRLISIDSSDLDLLKSSVLSDLEMASCLLRDGGLVIVNGVDDQDTKQLTTATMVNYFRKHGQSALTPIMSTGNKVYLTTTNWRRKYLDALSNNVILTQSGLLETSLVASLTNDLNELTSSVAL